MNQPKQSQWRKWVSVLQVLFILMAWAWLGLQYGRGDITDTYFNLYIALGLIVIAHGVISFFVDFGKKSGEMSRTLLGQALFWFEDSRLRPLSSGILPIVLFAAATITVAISVGGAGQSFFNPVVSGNPYVQGVGLSVDTLSQHSYFMNFVLGAVIPALFEEGTVFLGIQAMTSFLIVGVAFLFRNSRLIGNAGLYWMMTILSVGTWSFLFAVAHGRYDGLQGALIYAFSFEFTVQMLNQVTGSFFSWIPHMVHNGLVILGLQFSIIAFAAVVFIPNRFWRGAHNE